MKRRSRRAAVRYAELSRRRRKKRRLATPQAPPSQPSQAVSIPRRREPEVAPVRISRSYEYVRPELKRIGIIAGSLILLLFILAAVLGRIP